LKQCNGIASFYESVLNDSWNDTACHPLSIMQKLITIADGALYWLVIGLALNPDTDTFCSQSRLASYVKRQLCSQNDGRITVLAGDDQKALVVRVSSFPWVHGVSDELLQADSFFQG
jgi:hypothetical protein